MRMASRHCRGWLQLLLHAQAAGLLGTETAAPGQPGHQLPSQQPALEVGSGLPMRASACWASDSRGLRCLHSDM